MSYDRHIDQLCPHIVVDEPLFVSPLDRATIRPLKPIASSDSVLVRLNGAMDVPPYGIHLPASSVGAKIGPFNVTSGVNDRLVTSVDQGPVQTLLVPASKQLNADRLATFLNASAKGILFSAVRGRVVFRTASEGRQASVFIHTTSTLADVLGIGAGREYRGRMAASGWSLVADPTTLADRPTRLIVFDEPLKDFNPHVEISYNTVRQDCRRCLGLGVENDWRYSKTGEVGQVRDEALLIQEFQKLIYTVRGSNRFHLWYGTQIIEAIGRKLTIGGLVQNMIVSDIYSAFSHWQTIKQVQEEKVQVLSDEEFPFRLLSVTLQQSATDPTIIFVNSTIQNRSQKPIQLTRGLKLPEPLDLLGSTAQQGVIRQSLSNYVLTSG
jgi:hypothetical protein